MKCVGAASTSSQVGFKAASGTALYYSSMFLLGNFQTNVHERAFYREHGKPVTPSLLGCPTLWIHLLCGSLLVMLDTHKQQKIPRKRPPPLLGIISLTH